jgi:aminoglycoside phosphotransferase (APT) family kinase protein
VTITADAVAAALGASWPSIEIKDIRPLTGGQWATMAQVRIAGGPGGPEGPDEDVVVRVVPDALMGAKEVAVQGAAADAGLRTPRIHLTGDAGGPLGGAWAVMDFAVGRQPLAGLDGGAAIRQLPRLLRQLHRQLADTMTAIHRIDPAPVAARVREAAPGAAVGIDDLWSHLAAAAEPLPHLDAALERLRETKPRQNRPVVCHGDLHPFNLLVDDAGSMTVLDWTAAAIAPAAYDVAATWLLLRHPPLVAPAALRPAIEAGARVVARRFVRAYRAANPGADLSALDWYVALHSFRVVLDVTRWRNAGDPRATTHAFARVAPGAGRALHRATGVRPAPV